MELQEQKTMSERSYLNAKSLNLCDERTPSGFVPVEAPKRRSVAESGLLYRRDKNHLGLAHKNSKSRKKGARKE
jgi:hypothetical protein